MISYDEPYSVERHELPPRGVVPGERVILVLCASGYDYYESELTPKDCRRFAVKLIAAADWADEDKEEEA